MTGRDEGKMDEHVEQENVINDMKGRSERDAERERERDSVIEAQETKRDTHKRLKRET